MAYIDDTILLDFQESQLVNEKREAQHGLIDLAYDSTKAVDFVPPSAAQMMAVTNSTRNIQFPYLKDQSVVVTSTPGFGNIPINLGETGQYNFTAYDVFSGFRVTPSTFNSNVADKEWYVRNILGNVLQGMAEAKENVIKTILEAQKTQVLSNADTVSPVAGDYNFNTGTDALEIKTAVQNDTMFFNLQQIMKANKLGGRYKLVNSPAGLTVSTAEALKYRGNNEKNIEWAQAGMPETDRYESHQISTSNRWDGYMVKNGAIGLYSNYPYDFRERTSFAGKEWSISNMELPYIKSRANIFINNQATDATSLIAGSDQIMSHFEEMAIWDRFYVVYPVNSDLTTRANPIVKIQALTT